MEEIVRMSARSEIFTLGCSYRLLAAVCDVGDNVSGKSGLESVHGRGKQKRQRESG